MLGDGITGITLGNRTSTSFQFPHIHACILHHRSLPSSGGTTRLRSASTPLPLRRRFSVSRATSATPKPRRFCWPRSPPASAASGTPASRKTYRWGTPSSYRANHVSTVLHPHSLSLLQSVLPLSCSICSIRQPLRNIARTPGWAVRRRRGVPEEPRPRPDPQPGRRHRLPRAGRRRAGRATAASTTSKLQAADVLRLSGATCGPTDRGSMRSYYWSSKGNSST